MTEELEPRTPVHLLLDQLGLVVHALSASVMKREREGGDDPVVVPFEAADEGMQMRQLGPRGLRLPAADGGGVARLRGRLCCFVPVSGLRVCPILSRYAE